MSQQLSPTEVEYRLMDGTFSLPICLHGGAVNISRLPELTIQTPFEHQFSLPAGSHARFLKEISALYGACGFAALDGDQIVGLIRFSAKALEDALGGFCLQEEKDARRISNFDTTCLPAFQALAPKALWIECYQVLPSHQSRGIGKGLLQATIAWARATGWEEIYALAHLHIFPLLAWSGQMSRQTLQKMGFEIVSQRTEEALKEGAVSQRMGYHGEEVKRIWDEQYAHVTTEEAAVVYTMRLSL